MTAQALTPAVALAAASAITRLEELARRDATVSLLARLQAEALRAAGHGAWEAGVPPFERSRLDDGLPLLHGQTLAVEPAPVRALLARLAAVAESAGHAGAPPLRRALDAPAPGPAAVLELLAASIAQSAERIEALAAGGLPSREGRLGSGLASRHDRPGHPDANAAGAADAEDIDPDLLAILGRLAALPLLFACGRAAAPLLDGARWDAGYCPVCAAWPSLAELRGLERTRWLRCGRCGAAWTYYLHRCAFCANADHKTLGYLAPEADREARRAVVCDACHAYLKTLATVGAMAPAEIAIHDLTTLELDVAALDAGYARPDLPGFPLEVHLVAARLEPALQRTGWLFWRR